MAKQLVTRVAVAVLGATAVSGSAHADEGWSRQGTYLAVMPSYVFATRSTFNGPFGKTKSETQDGVGANLLFGANKGLFAFEFGATYAERSGPEELGAVARANMFPFEAAPWFYGSVGTGWTRIMNHPDVNASQESPFNHNDAFSLWTLEGGVGAVHNLWWGDHPLSLRADVRYRYGDRMRFSSQEDVDSNAPQYLNDVIVSLGIQIPFGIPPKEEPTPAAPIAVVAPMRACSDTQDNDADGLIDYPGDPGCTSADDDDETDPPQCANGRDDDGDGLIDFPSDKGCSAADDTDEVDPCKTPASGERVSLKGCGTGDVIVLRGVTFDFDKATLTVNAKTILDNVAEELVAYPEIKVEVGGHTDSKGSDDYNQKLSERRAAAVVTYLGSRGIAGDRMTPIGYGESQPVADNGTDEGREVNRRVEMKIVASGPGGHGAPEPSPAGP